MKVFHYIVEFVEDPSLILQNSYPVFFCGGGGRGAVPHQFQGISSLTRD